MRSVFTLVTRSRSGQKIGTVPFSSSQDGPVTQRPRAPKEGCLKRLPTPYLPINVTFANIILGMLVLISACSCGQLCSLPDDSLYISFSEEISEEKANVLKCISHETTSDSGNKLTYQIYINEKTIGNRSIDQFSYELQDNHLTLVSWSDGTFTLDQVIEELESIIQNLEDDNVSGVADARSRLQGIRNKPSRYDTSFRDLSFAIDVGGSRVFIRTVFSYVNEAPFIIRFEIAN